MPEGECMSGCKLHNTIMQYNNTTCHHNTTQHHHHTTPQAHKSPNSPDKKYQSNKRPAVMRRSDSVEFHALVYSVKLVCLLLWEAQKLKSDLNWRNQTFTSYLFIDEIFWQHGECFSCTFSGWHELFLSQSEFSSSYLMVCLPVNNNKTSFISVHVL